MKNTVTVILFFAIAFNSCIPAVKTKIVDNSKKGEVAEVSTAQSAYQQNNSSWIGKTTVELENMKWFYCAGTVIESDQIEIRYVVSQMAKSQKECRNGAGKILLERFVSRDKSRIVFEVVDEINIQSNYPEKEYNWTICKINGSDDEESYVIHHKDQRQADLTEIYDMWTVDLIAGKFIKKKNSEGVSCVNPNYSDDF